MSTYANVKTYELRYSDFDFKDELRPSSLLGIVQESACLSADELGFGYADLKPKRFGFIVVHTYCKLLRPVRLGEVLAVETWPLPPRMVFFERDYRVRAGEEEVAAIASRWCLVDLNDFSLLRPERLGAAHENCPYRAEKAVEVSGWKIPRVQNGREALRMRVTNSACDHYFHANNARYADFFFDCFTVEELAARRVTEFRIAYEKQVKEGSELVFLREDTPAGTLCEMLCGGELMAQFWVGFARE